MKVSRGETEKCFQKNDLLLDIEACEVARP